MMTIETDYLVVGAGAAGMAFVDELIASSDGDVVMVDRRYQPGGHWNDAYRFVRIHQASANYGVNSLALGTDLIDSSGPNAGFYERATAPEICGYFQKVLDDHLLPSSKVRFFGGWEYSGGDAGVYSLTSRLTGETTTVRVRRKLVDTTYLEVTIPATHTPAFSVDADSRFIPVGDLVKVAEPPSGYTIFGAGKTGMDAVNWLLDHGVDADKIRWVKPHDMWLLDRALWQPLDLVVDTAEGFSLCIEALANAEDFADLFARLEDSGQFWRIDPKVQPTRFRGAIMSREEMAGLGQIERVVRLGRVVHLGASEIVLEHGTIPTDAGQIHVDCTAHGFRTTHHTVPIFEPGKITLQSLMGGFTTFNAAVVAFVEACWEDDVAKNRLCPPTPPPTLPTDWIYLMLGAISSMEAQTSQPGMTDWLERSRLNLMRGMANHMSDPRLQAALTRTENFQAPAASNGERLLARSTVPSSASV